MFALGTFSNGTDEFAGVVVDDRVIPIASLLEQWIARGGKCDAIPPAATIVSIVENWERDFPELEKLAAFARSQVDPTEYAELSSLRPRPPIRRPGKILHSAANFKEHVAEMEAYNVLEGRADPKARFNGEKQGARPYLFLKAASALTGAFEPIEIPRGEGVQIDWEAEVAVVIGRGGRNIPVEKARDHIAGYMAANDITRRDTLWRQDRPNFRTDWLASKSTDGFLPMGPVLMPAAFVSKPGELRITLKVNGETKQSGQVGDMIFSPEEQISFASQFMTLEPGDIFVTGTVGGVGQASGTYLRPGDVVETEISGVGRLCNTII